MKKFFTVFAITMCVGAMGVALTLDVGGGFMYSSPYVLNPTVIADVRVPIVGDLFLTGQANLMVNKGFSAILGGVRYSFLRDSGIRPFAGLDGGIYLTTAEHRPSTLPIYGINFGMDFTFGGVDLYMKGAYRVYNNPQALSYLMEIGAGMTLDF